MDRSWGAGHDTEKDTRQEYGERLGRVVEEDHEEHLPGGQSQERFKRIHECAKQIHLARYWSEEPCQECRNEESREGNDIPNNVPFGHVSTIQELSMIGAAENQFCLP